MITERNALDELRRLSKPEDWENRLAVISRLVGE
jgi:hypothetical protein